MTVIKRVFPTTFKECVYLLLTFCNAGITSVFIKTGHFPEATFSGVTTLLCFGIWVAASTNKQE